MSVEQSRRPVKRVEAGARGRRQRQDRTALSGHQSDAVRVGRVAVGVGGTGAEARDNERRQWDEFSRLNQRINLLQEQLWQQQQQPRRSWWWR